MKTRATILLLSLAACSSQAAVAPPAGAIGFDDAPAASGWRFESTGGQGPHATWQVKDDAAALSPGRVMSLALPNHDSDDRFNLCWSPERRFRDGRIGVAVRADSGEVDQGGGPMWRVQDAGNYYLCRWNPLETNYRVYVVSKGVRRQLGTARVEGAAGEWHRLEVEHVGTRITCWFDGRKMLEAEDATIAAEGGIGLWTKADACTSFDDLSASAAGQ
jgi:hypothetical protein